MFWLTIVLFGLLYLFIGMIIGFFMFDDEIDAMFFGGFLWPLFVLSIVVYYLLLFPMYKAASLVGNIVDGLIVSIRRRRNR